MFNLKNMRKSAQSPYEKYHRDENLGPKANDDAPIPEKQLPHRNGFEQTVTEDQMKDRDWDGEKEAQVVEKSLEEDNGKYVDHRQEFNLTAPPINVLVHQIRNKRVADDYKVDKESHWSQDLGDKKQQGALPKWKKNAPQHGKPVLNNDPQRFGTSDDPVGLAEGKIQPLVGDITTADINKVCLGVKTGAAGEYDAAIMAVLRLAHDERRELTDIERQTVNKLKIDRTKKLLDG